MLSVLGALAVLGYLVYCAHRDARQPEPEKKVYLPSSKAIIPPPMQDKARKQEQTPDEKKKKKQPDKDVFIPSSKSGVMRMPALPSASAASDG